MQLIGNVKKKQFIATKTGTNRAKPITIHVDLVPKHWRGQCCGSGIRCLFDPWIRNGKNSGSGSEKNNPDHISESVETLFWVKIFKFFDADPGW
jgi:hypothetical protein